MPAVVQKWASGLPPEEEVGYHLAGRRTSAFRSEKSTWSISGTRMKKNSFLFPFAIVVDLLYV